RRPAVALAWRFRAPSHIGTLLFEPCSAIAVVFFSVFIRASRASLLTYALMRWSVFLLFIAAGCSSAPALELVPVKGKALLGTTALAGALLTFHPESADG